MPDRKTSGASHEATGAEKSQMDLNEVLSEVPSWLKGKENIKLDASSIESKEGAKSGKDDILGEINMEAAISTDEVIRAGGFGAMDDIGSLLPVAIDATDFEHSLLDARDFEGPKEEVSRPGLGWTELSGASHEASEAEKSQMKVHDVHTEFPSWPKNEEDVKLDTCQIESKEGVRVRSSNEVISGEINMEAAISIDDVTRAGGFGAMDDIGSFLPVAMDATDFEHSLLDARGFEGPQEEISRPGLGWTKPVLPNISLLSQE